jgi:hypothetical protein
MNDFINFNIRIKKIFVKNNINRFFKKFIILIKRKYHSKNYKSKSQYILNYIKKKLKVSDLSDIKYM